MSADADRDVRDAGVFTAFTALSRGLGLVRSWLMARVLGGTAGADAFWAAFRLVNFFRLFLGEGALGSAMLPVLKDLEAKDHAGAVRFAERCSRAALAICLLLMVALVAFLRPVLALYVPDLPPEALVQTRDLTRIMAPYLALIGLASVLMTPLQAFRDFGPPAAHPLLFNLALISAGLAAHLFPDPARAFAWGVVAGGVMQVALLARAARRHGISLLASADLGLSDPALREVARLTVPTLAGVLLMRINSVVDVRFASSLPTGSLACLQYGFLLYTAFLGVSSVGVATVYFTALSQSRAEDDAAGFRKALAEGGGLLLTITVPGAILGFAFPEALASIFAGGRFGADELARTAGAVRGYFAGLAAAGLFQIFSRALYAGKQQSLVVRAGVVSALLNIYLDWLWVHPYGVQGLAAASSVSLGVNALLQAWMLRADLPVGPLAASAGRTLVAALVSVAACRGALDPALRGSPLMVVPLFGIVFVAVLGATGSWEIRRLGSILWGRMRRRARPDAGGS